MTNYIWIATYPDSIADPLAWKPHSLPKAGDTATIATGVVLDAGKSTSAYYTVGNSNQAQTPKLKLSDTTALSGQVLGYAKFVNQGNSTLKFTIGNGNELSPDPGGYLNLYNYGTVHGNITVGTGVYWVPNSDGHLNLYNYGTVHGSITLNDAGSDTLNLFGSGNFGGTISLPEGGHSGGAPVSISNNLLPNATIHNEGFGAGLGPTHPITFSGRADPSDVFNIGSNTLTLTQMQFLPSVVLDSDFSSVVFASYFSDNLKASFQNDILTIKDLGLGRSLSLPVTLPTTDVIPGGSWELFEPQHSPGSNFYGLTLAYSNPPASGPGVIPL